MIGRLTHWRRQGGCDKVWWGITGGEKDCKNRDFDETMPGGSAKLPTHIQILIYLGGYIRVFSLLAWPSLRTALKLRDKCRPILSINSRHGWNWRQDGSQPELWLERKCTVWNLSHKKKIGVRSINHWPRGQNFSMNWAVLAFTTSPSNIGLCLSS